MSGHGLVHSGRLGLGPMRQALGSPHHPAGSTCLSDADRDELGVGTICDLSGHGRRKAMATIATTGALAVSDQLKLVEWTSGKWGV